MWALLGRTLYLLAWPVSFLTLRSTTRTRVLVCYQDEVIVIRNWFGSQLLALPGGGVQRSESPIEAAIREVREEVGIEISIDNLESAGDYAYTFHRLPYQCHFFVARLAEKPALRPRPIEILQTQWMQRQSIDVKDCEPDIEYALQRLTENAR